MTDSDRTVRSARSWLVLLAVIIVLGAWWQTRSAAAQEAEVEGDVDLGAQLYAQHCAQCHASDGSGAEVGQTGRRAPALIPSENPNVTAAYVDLVMRTGRMPPAADPFDNQPRREIFSEDERLAIVAFTTRQFGLTNDLDEITDIGEGDPGHGQAVYAANCAACHGSTGAGGVAGGGAWTPNVSQYDAVTIAEAIRVGPFQMPAFSDDTISDEEVADVATFLEEVHSEAGTPLGIAELNPVFASGFVALLALVMMLSLFWISSKPTWFPDPDAVPEDRKPTPDATAGANVAENPGDSHDE